MRAGLPSPVRKKETACSLLAKHSSGYPPGRITEKISLLLCWVACFVQVFGPAFPAAATLSWSGCANRAELVFSPQQCHGYGPFSSTEDAWGLTLGLMCPGHTQKMLDSQKFCCTRWLHEPFLFQSTLDLLQDVLWPGGANMEGRNPWASR